MKTLQKITLAVFTASLFIFSACVKKDFDAPPDTTGIDPNLPVNRSIWELKSLYTGVATKITDDITIAGIVIADDKSGNFYKQIIIQDTSSGIPVLLSRSSGLNNDYPIGRKVYIKCKGLYLGAYGGFVQLGSTPDAAGDITDIPTAMIGEHVIKGAFDLSKVTARKVTISDLKTINQTNIKWLGTLIELDSVEFTGNAAGLEYAEPATLSSGTDREIEDCADNKIVMRNSAYSSFRGYLTPTGKGTLRAIYSRYNSTAQLLIRDTSDAKFTAPRCGSLATLQSILSIRELFQSTNVVPQGVKIKGIVISDKNAKNINSQNVVLQDATAGIVVRFTSSTGLPSLGDEIEVNVSSGTLTEFQGVLQVGGLSSSKFIKTGTGTITPRIATVKQVNDSLEVWESTLVKVMNGTLSGGTTGTYSGSTTLTDGTGSITHFAFTSSTFANTNYVTTPKNYTGIVGQYNTTKQLSIRNLSDVE